MSRKNKSSDNQARERRADNPALPSKTLESLPEEANAALPGQEQQGNEKPGMGDGALNPNRENLTARPDFATSPHPTGHMSDDADEAFNESQQEVENSDNAPTRHSRSSSNRQGKKK